MFTNDICHADVKSYAKYGGNHLSHLRLFAYTVEDKYTFIVEFIEKKIQNQLNVRKIVQFASH